MEKPLQLSDPLPQLPDMTVEAAIDSNPYKVEAMREAGNLSLSRGALLYLREVLSDWHEFEEIVREEQKRGRI